MTVHRTVTIEEAQRICGVTRRTIYNWMALGRVHFVRTPGGSRRILVETLHVAGDIDPPDELTHEPETDARRLA